MAQISEVRNSNFDWLRLFLAGSVAYFHAGYFSFVANGHDVPFGLIPFPMVPTFLALSGYLLFNSFSASRSWFHFIQKRALRIFPALCVSIAISGLVWGFSAGVLGSLRIYLGGGILIVAHGGNGSLWSLLWEEIAYLLMAVFLVMKAYDRRWLIWLSLIVGCVIAGLDNQHEPWWRITNLIPALFTGNLVYLYRQPLSRVSWKILVTLLILVTSINSFFHLQPQAWYMVPIGAFLALLLCLNAPQLPRLPFDISYGLYVFHDPIFFTAAKICPTSFSHIFLIGAPAVIGISIASWFLVEKPALKLKRLIIQGARAPTSGLTPTSRTHD